MEAKTSQQMFKSQAANATQSRDEEVTGCALYEMIQRAGFRCMVSGVELDPDEASIDHTIPLSEGGSHSMHNVTIVHEVINRMKGEMTLDEFIGWCRKVAQWNG